MSPPMLSRLPASLLVTCGAAFELAILPEASQGQRMADLAAPWHITSVGPAEPSIRRYPATYYFEGAAIGGSLFATTGALVWYELGCLYSDTQDDCTAGRIVRAGLVGALVGATVGALVGGLVPAPYPRPLRGSPVKAALIGACAGALWGFGPFSHFCLNGCNSAELRLGFSIAAVGAFAGLLVGL